MASNNPGAYKAAMKKSHKVEFSAGDLSSIIIRRLLCCKQVVLSPSELVKVNCEWLNMATPYMAKAEEVWTKLLLQERGNDTPNQEVMQEKSLLPSSLSSGSD